MTHELKHIFHAALKWQQAGKKAVLATVVHLEGSSYRKPGVRMLMSNRGEAVGAISGGCVEKDIMRQARSVFQSGKAKMMAYDGRFRVGCEGVIYLLLEPLYISEGLWNDFNAVLKKRQAFRTESYYYLETGENAGIGTLIYLNGTAFTLHTGFHTDRISGHLCFKQGFPPVFQLYIFGAEHDAVHLSKSASSLRWEVIVVASPDESKSHADFPGAGHLITPAFESLDSLVLDEHTAVVLMSHSFHKDVQYLMALKDASPAYFGVLGPGHRRERLLAELLNQCPDVSPEFLDQLHGPAGINIGAESAPEVAVSILAEILSVKRKQKPMALREKKGSIHG